MKQVAAILLATLILAPATLFHAPATLFHAPANGAHAEAVSRTNIPLTNLSPPTSQNSQLISADNPGHVNQSPITHGFQLTDNGYATYLPHRHYAMLTGTLYGDDNSSNTGAILIEDASGATPRVLARYDVPKGARRSFKVAVRGVSRLTITQTQCCAVCIDVIAALTH